MVRGLTGRIYFMKRRIAKNEEIALQRWQEFEKQDSDERVLDTKR
ncbi:hypothetical protein SpAn4DRAFT_1191 [Sporomusa ovata]|uniref:Uncharacterized protein n=2 Tax=Sporomusa ovata TaxID=2378 RepID=A0A0U1KS43_9FIRM|nr:hypothetical protein SpAn4DRAFT_1191 [Sporomusa ovata]